MRLQTGMGGFPDQSSPWGSRQRVPLDVSTQIMGWGEGGWLKAEGLRSTLGRETEKKEKPQQGGCYRAGDKTGNWEAGRRVRVTYLCNSILMIPCLP